MTPTPADPGVIDGLPCACRFHSVESAIRQGSETGVLFDPDDPIRECALHEALRERVAELEPLVADGVRRSDNCQRWQARAEDAEARGASLFNAVRHGDAEHETWLQQAIADHFAGRPVERPKGMGNKERAEAAEAHAVELAGALDKIARSGPVDRKGNDDAEAGWSWCYDTARAALGEEEG